MLERERLIEIVIAIPAVATMIVAMTYIGSTYETGSGDLGGQGGEMLVGAIIGFIFLMVAVGVALAFLTNDPTDGLEDDSASSDAETETA